MTAPAPLAVVSAFLEAEAALPDRHHGPKGRTSRFLSALRESGCPVTHATLGGIDWALQGTRLGIMTTDQAAAWLIATWLGVD